MGANMADGSITAGAVAGSKSLARSSDVTTRSRADALRHLSASGSSRLAFAKSAESAAAPDPVANEIKVAEPGKGMLSTSIQLILAETRTQENQAAYTDKPTVDKALNSYNDSQTSVRETMSLAVLSGSPHDRRAGETSA